MPSEVDSEARDRLRGFFNDCRVSLNRAVPVSAAIFEIRPKYAIFAQVRRFGCKDSFGREIDALEGVVVSKNAAATLSVVASLVSDAGVSILPELHEETWCRKLDKIREVSANCKIDFERLVSQAGEAKARLSVTDRQGSAVVAGPKIDVAIRDLPTRLFATPALDGLVIRALPGDHRTEPASEEDEHTLLTSDVFSGESVSGQTLIGHDQAAPDTLLQHRVVEVTLHADGGGRSLMFGRASRVNAQFVAIDIQANTRVAAGEIFQVEGDVDDRENYSVMRRKFDALTEKLVKAGWRSRLDRGRGDWAVRYEQVPYS